jgi:hypothetical protein
MLKVGLRKTWLSLERGASKRREARCRINRAEAGPLYPSVAAAAPARYSAVGRSRLASGKVERQRGWGERGCGRGWNFQPLGTSRVCQLMPRATDDALDMAPKIGENTRRTKFLAAAVRIGRLLEDQICLYRRLLYRGRRIAWLLEMLLPNRQQAGLLFSTLFSDFLKQKSIDQLVAS